MSSPDHYSVLGVLPSADEVVIRAAYRALAQRYHPDKWQGDLSVATQKMAEINAAYAVLSDREKKREYDQRQRASAKSEPYQGDDNRDQEPEHDPLRDDWAIAISIYPDLVVLDKQLAKLSWRIAYGFRAFLLEKKTFDHRHSVAKQIEREYLERYFGTNKEIQEYAKILLVGGERQAALELNRVVNVMGSSADNSRIIHLIDAKFSRQKKPTYTSPKNEETEYYKKYPNEGKESDPLFVPILLFIAFVFVMLIIGIALGV